MVTLCGPNHYLVTNVVDGLPEDVALVEILWDETDDEAIFRCNFHRTHIALASRNVPPCCCIAEVIDYRRQAFLTDTKD